jgi:hypothetical protein
LRPVPLPVLANRALGPLRLARGNGVDDARVLGQRQFFSTGRAHDGLVEFIGPAKQDLDKRREDRAAANASNLAVEAHVVHREVVEIARRHTVLGQAFAQVGTVDLGSRVRRPTARCPLP